MRFDTLTGKEVQQEYIGQNLYLHWISLYMDAVMNHRVLQTEKNCNSSAGKHF